ARVSPLSLHDALPIWARCTEMIHGLPERTPLNPVIVRVLEREGYRIESLMFESRPNFWVTASLYVPAGSGPFPGIISPCGHYPRSEEHTSELQSRVEL